MPLFFASNAIYPIVMMPAWLQVIARINPLTYEVDALRAERDALNWALMRGARNGRVAWQFAKDWAGTHTTPRNT